jgi:VCBS repeat-containing protein
MSTTIGNTSGGVNDYSSLDGVNYTGSIAGQTFKTPSAANTLFIFDKIDIRLDVNPDSSPGFGFNASLFEWNGNSRGPILRETTGSYTGGGLPQDITIDFEDIILDPTKTYGFGILATSGNTDNKIQMGSQYPDGGYLMEMNNVWSVSQNADIYFTIYLRTAAAGNRASELVPLYLPTGNYDESTDIGINLSGWFGGIGQFSIPNPAQSGNTYVRYGKYGKLHLGTNGQYEYFIDDEKLYNVNTGQNVFDEFPVTLTYPDGSQATSTYRVNISGYSDPDGNKVRDAGISIFGFP